MKTVLSNVNKVFESKYTEYVFEGIVLIGVVGLILDLIAFGVVSIWELV